MGGRDIRTKARGKRKKKNVFPLRRKKTTLLSGKTQRLRNISLKKGKERICAAARGLKGLSKGEKGEASERGRVLPDGTKRNLMALLRIARTTVQIKMRKRGLPGRLGED